jgi:excisionase family DNA binding protein
MEHQFYQAMRGIIIDAIREVMTDEFASLKKSNRVFERKLLTYSEAMKLLNISKPIFFRLLREKRLQSVVLEKRTFRIDSSELTEFIDRQKEFRILSNPNTKSR